MGACFYCGAKCRETSVYVIGEVNDPATVKVGYAAKPVKRLASLRKQTGRDLSILALVTARCEFKAIDIEDAAHKALAHLWSGRGEWFSCSPETAAEAVRAAAKRLGLRGERP